MAHEFRLPDIGEGLTEAEIVRWLVEVGEHVAADQPIVEVETDKAVVEIPSPFAGTVLSHGGAPGDVIEVGSVLVVVGDEVPEPDLEEEGMASADSSAIEVPRHEPSVVDESFEPAADEASVAPIVGTLSEDAEVLRPRVPAAPSSGGGVKALPIVRKLARDHGIDISTVHGTGPEGRITREDVLAVRDAVSPQPDSKETPGAAPAVPRPVVGGGDQRQKMSRLRRTIAANMSQSWSEIPHVTTFDDVDATRLLETRSALSRRHETKIPIEALVVKAVLPALESFPEFNATIDGEHLILHGARDIGIAVDTEDGLLVAVIKDAVGMGVLDLATEISRLGDGARNRSLSPGELTGQTFTVSNIGAVGGGHGTPIVPFGTTAILSVGRARDRVIVVDGDVVVAPVMPLSLSYDHRVVDGGQGRRFMSLLMENLEEPALFLAV